MNEEEILSMTISLLLLFGSGNGLCITNIRPYVC